MPTVSPQQIDDYTQRAVKYGMPPKDKVLEAVKADPDTVFLDVRSRDELSMNGVLRKRRYVHCHCTMSDQSDLVENAKNLMPNTNGKFPCFWRHAHCAALLSLLLLTFRASGIKLFL